MDKWGRRAILLSGAVVVSPDFLFSYPSLMARLKDGSCLGCDRVVVWIDVPQTPQAVVACVIIFNAAFGYSWGPIPWLYPPEVLSYTLYLIKHKLNAMCRLCRFRYEQRVFPCLPLRTGHSTMSWASLLLFFKKQFNGGYMSCMVDSAWRASFLYFYVSSNG